MEVNKDNNLNDNKVNLIYSSRNKDNNIFNDYLINTLSITKVKTFEGKIPKLYDLNCKNNRNNKSNITFKPKDDYFIKEEKKKKLEERKKHFKEFLLRNKLFFEKKRERIERQKILFEKGKKIKSEQEIIEGFNRLIDDANRRFEARERRDQLIKDVKNSTNNNNYKKYNNNQRNIIYNRFISYEKKSKEKIKKAIIEKENEKKKKEAEILKEMKSQNKKVSKEKANFIFNSLYNKGRKIYNEKRCKSSLNKTQVIKRNKSIGEKNINNQTLKTENKTLKKTKSISKFKNIQPRYMNFFQNVNEDTLNKLKKEKLEFINSTLNTKNSNINNSNNSTTNSKKSQINYSNNDSYLKIYQSNFIQIIKFKNVPYEINTSDLKENNKDSKNLSRKISKTETREASKKFYTPNNFD